jgi:hypothetical protein
MKRGRPRPSPSLLAPSTLCTQPASGTAITRDPTRAVEAEHEPSRSAHSTIGRCNSHTTKRSKSRCAIPIYWRCAFTRQNFSKARLDQHIEKRRRHSRASRRAACAVPTATILSSLRRRPHIFWTVQSKMIGSVALVDSLGAAASADCRFETSPLSPSIELSERQNTGEPRHGGSRGG